MDKIKLFSGLTFLVACGLAVYLFFSIYGPMKEQQRIAEVEAKIIKQLEMIKEAQKVYFETNGVYADNWDKLVAFVDSGIVYDVQTTQNLMVRPIELRHLGDSVWFTYDTLGQSIVKDKIFPKETYPDFDLKKLPFVPGTETKFKLEVGTLTEGQSQVSVIKVTDPAPINPMRKEGDPIRMNWPLQFGSLDEVSLEGNWK